MANTITSFTAGDIVVSVYGNGDGSGPYGDNQASPIVLEELTTSGTVVGQLVLPQSTTTVNGVTQNAISGEYGSSSEGSLQLSADGQSLTIAGYGVNAATFNSAEAGLSPSAKQAGGAYGNAALAQTYSVPNGGTNGAPTGVTPVARVVADIRADGTVDTSTALFNVDNENNPRSVVTSNGSSYYVAGQGVSGDGTQGMAYAADGSSTPTAINTSFDQRTAEIYNGNLYVSVNSSQGKSAGIYTYGTGLPTSAMTPTLLPGTGPSITLTAAQANGINTSRVGSTVYMAPENFFFASPTTLYIADDGKPKNGSANAAGIGDGGLQKWTYNGSTWNLQYTLSSGLNLVNNAGTSGTTGLIGLTGQVNAAAGTVTFFATNATIGDTDQTYLYTITDNLSATTASASFTTLATAAPNTNIRGVAFAPQAAPCYCTGTRIRVVRKGYTADIAVERLAIGDLAVTASGECRPIAWIGHRTIDSVGHADLPVRVSAHAFGDNLPERDLFLSPGHPVLVGADEDSSCGHLVPIMCLINGTTIARAAVEDVTYWHIELDAHDILLAEGLPAESYIDLGSRPWFGGADGALHDPDLALPGMPRCRPVAVDGPVIEAERRRLDAVFALRLSASAAWPASDDVFAPL